MKRMFNLCFKNLILVLVLSIVALPFSATTLFAEENKTQSRATQSKTQPSDVNQAAAETQTPEAAKGVAGPGAAQLSPLAIGGIVVLAIGGVALMASGSSGSSATHAHNPAP